MACAIAGSPSAQVRPTPAPRAAEAPPPEPVAQPVTIDPAERALVESRFADVETLAAEPDAPPVRRIALALADAARGRYEAAVQRLEPDAATDPAGEAALELGLLLGRLGRRDVATRHLSAVASAPMQGERSAARLLRLGRALAALGQPRRANSILQEAAALAPADPRPSTAWAELFLEKHNVKEAVELFMAALKLDDRWVPALLGLARALADDDGAASGQAVQRVLAIAPESTDARLLLAERALDERRLADAGRELEQVLGVNAASVDALALRAAIAAIEDRPDEADRFTQQALAVNPRAGDVFRAIGAQLAGHYRFEEAVAFLRTGVAIEPENPRVQAALGMHLLRTGDEAAARTALDEAFKKDPFDVVTYNLLALLDTLDKFETVAEGDLIVKLHADEARVMREPITSLAKRALVALGTRYDVTPRGPILIEMFPRHDDFAVRTLGLPGMVGALGACFGRVVTLDSPRAQKPPGSFNWQATLWHELAHVVTLQLSAQRVPRWLTEGASVFEERRADPAWGREGEHDFLLAYASGKLIPLATLNAGFTDRRTIGLAYHQSSLVVEHLVERFGDAGLQRLLKAFGAGQPQDAALQAAFGVSIEALQTSFDTFLADRFGRVRTALTPVDEAMPDGEGPDGVTLLTAFADRHADKYAVQLTAGRLLAARGAAEEARRVLERAVTLVPQTMGDESPRVGLAELAQARQDRARAMAELEQVLAGSHTAMDSARRLLAVAREANDSARLRSAVDRIVSLDPFDGAAHAEMGRLALARDDGPAAVRALELALSLNPSDVVAVHTDLAEAYLLSGQLDLVRRHAIRALELAPRYERAQELLLRVVDGR